MGLVNSPLLQRLCAVKYFLTKNPNGFANYKNIMDSVMVNGDIKVMKLKNTLPLGVTFDRYITEENFEKLDSMNRQAVLLQTVAVNKSFQAKLQGLKEIQSASLPPIGVTVEDLKNWTDKAKEDTLQIKEFLPDNIKGDINLKTSKVLFLAIPHDKGWSATVDGKESVIEKVDAGLMGILLEKGNHKIELKFKPPFVQEAGTVAGHSGSSISGRLNPG